MWKEISLSLANKSYNIIISILFRRSYKKMNYKHTKEMNPKIPASRFAPWRYFLFIFFLSNFIITTRADDIKTGYDL